jgi:hypothetical protein
MIRMIRGFKMNHQQKRAQERYYLSNLNDSVVLNEILNSRCISLKEDLEKFSRIFLIRYTNKFIRVVTDYNVLFVKTVLPLKSTDLPLINKLIQI